MPRIADFVDRPTDDRSAGTMYPIDERRVDLMPFLPERIRAG